MKKFIKTRIEKLVFGGQGLGKHESKVVLAWNALPEEEVEVEIYKNKKTYSEGIAISILNQSPYRVEPEEEHFLSCSPWQILSWEQENIWKKKIAEETYIRIGDLSELPDFEIISDSENQFNYRNKMEYELELNPLSESKRIKEELSDFKGNGLNYEIKIKPQFISDNEIILNLQFIKEIEKIKPFELLAFRKYKREFERKMILNQTFGFK
ncbi:hypothetical protein NLD30_10625, partial [SCandidatus Aminicenantes bacterium Aminicenantia_JdfR_composite]|nr:hypothetical protein [SCandidatus Aminicenantes bacterium Aminicenantia_JdfR_composite]